MNVSLTDELKDFVKKKIKNGQYPSEEAVIEAALKRLRDQEDEGRKTGPTLDDLIDHEFVEYCPEKPTTVLPWRRSLRRPPRSRTPWRVSSSRKSERTASDATIFLRHQRPCQTLSR